MKMNRTDFSKKIDDEMIYGEQHDGGVEVDMRSHRTLELNRIFIVSRRHPPLATT